MRVQIKMVSMVCAPAEFGLPFTSQPQSSRGGHKHTYIQFVSACGCEHMFATARSNRYANVLLNELLSKFFFEFSAEIVNNFVMHRYLLGIGTKKCIYICMCVLFKC